MGDVLGKVFWLSVGGVLGTNLRYWLGVWVQNKVSGVFPWGTFVINVSGSFLIGLLVVVLTEHVLFLNTAAYRLALVTGFLGAYTTFSTFEFDSFTLLESGAGWLALGNIAGSVAAGLLAVFLGTIAGKMI